MPPARLGVRLGEDAVLRPARDIERAWLPSRLSPFAVWIARREGARAPAAGPPSDDLEDPSDDPAAPIELRGGALILSGVDEARAYLYGPGADAERLRRRAERIRSVLIARNEAAASSEAGRAAAALGASDARPPGGGGPLEGARLAEAARSVLGDRAEVLIPAGGEGDALERLRDAAFEGPPGAGRARVLIARVPGGAGAHRAAYVAYPDGSVAFCDPLGRAPPHPEIAARLAGVRNPPTAVAEVDGEADEASSGRAAIAFADALLRVAPPAASPSSAPAGRPLRPARWDSLPADVWGAVAERMGIRDALVLLGVSRSTRAGFAVARWGTVRLDARASRLLGFASRSGLIQSIQRLEVTRGQDWIRLEGLWNRVREVSLDLSVVSWGELRERLDACARVGARVVAVHASFWGPGFAEATAPIAAAHPHVEQVSLRGRKDAIDPSRVAAAFPNARALAYIARVAGPLDADVGPLAAMRRLEGLTLNLNAPVRGIGRVLAGPAGRTLRLVHARAVRFEEEDARAVGRAPRLEEFHANLQVDHRVEDGVFPYDALAESGSLRRVGLVLPQVWGAAARTGDAQRIARGLRNLEGVRLSAYGYNGALDALCGAAGLAHNLEWLEVSASGLSTQHLRTVAESGFRGTLSVFVSTPGHAFDGWADPIRRIVDAGGAVRIVLVGGLPEGPLRALVDAGARLERATPSLPFRGLPYYAIAAMEDAVDRDTYVDYPLAERTPLFPLRPWASLPPAWFAP